MEGERRLTIKSEKPIEVKKETIQTKLRRPEEKESKSDEEKVSLKIETKRDISYFLKMVTTDAETEFAIRWFGDHEKEIEAKGYNPNSKNPEYMKNVTWKLDGFKQLETDPNYNKENTKINNIYFLRKELVRGSLSKSVLGMMLDLFTKRAERLREKLIETDESKATVVIENELKELSRVIEELTKKTAEKETTKGDL